MDEGYATPKETIFFEGEFFEARLLLEQIIKTATKRVIIIDGYIDAETFDMLDVRAPLSFLLSKYSYFVIKYAGSGNALWPRATECASGILTKKATSLESKVAD